MTKPKPLSHTHTELEWIVESLSFRLCILCWEGRCQIDRIKSFVTFYFMARPYLTFSRRICSHTKGFSQTSLRCDRPSVLSENFLLSFRTPVERVKPCIRDFLETSRLCLPEDNRDGLNVTMRMIDAAIDFVCHNSGDRLACKKEKNHSGFFHGICRVFNHATFLWIFQCLWPKTVGNVFRITEKECLAAWTKPFQRCSSERSRTTSIISSTTKTVGRATPSATAWRPSCSSAQTLPRPTSWIACSWPCETPRRARDGPGTRRSSSRRRTPSRTGWDRGCQWRRHRLLWRLCPPWRLLLRFLDYFEAEWQWQWQWQWQWHQPHHCTCHKFITTTTTTIEWLIFCEEIVFAF